MVGLIVAGWAAPEDISVRKGVNLPVSWVCKDTPKTESRLKLVLLVNMEVSESRGNILQVPSRSQFAVMPG